MSRVSGSQCVGGGRGNAPCQITGRYSTERHLPSRVDLGSTISEQGHLEALLLAAAKLPQTAASPSTVSGLRPGEEPIVDFGGEDANQSPDVVHAEYLLGGHTRGGLLFVGVGTRRSDAREQRNAGRNDGSGKT